MQSMKRREERGERRGETHKQPAEKIEDPRARMSVDSAWPARQLIPPSVTPRPSSAVLVSRQKEIPKTGAAAKPTGARNGGLRKEQQKKNTAEVEGVQTLGTTLPNSTQPSIGDAIAQVCIKHGKALSDSTHAILWREESESRWGKRKRGTTSATRTRKPTDATDSWRKKTCSQARCKASKFFKRPLSARAQSPLSVTQEDMPERKKDDKSAAHEPTIAQRAGFSTMCHNPGGWDRVLCVFSSVLECVCVRVCWCVQSKPSPFDTRIIHCTLFSLCACSYLRARVRVCACVHTSKHFFLTSKVCFVLFSVRGRFPLPIFFVSILCVPGNVLFLSGCQRAP